MIAYGIAVRIVMCLGHYTIVTVHEANNQMGDLGTDRNNTLKCLEKLGSQKALS